MTQHNTFYTNGNATTTKYVYELLTTQNIIMPPTYG